MKKVKAILGFLILGLYASAQSPGACSKSDSWQYSVNAGPFTLAYSDSGCGLNYVQGSVMTQQRTIKYGFNVNGTGLPTTVSISGIPSSGMIQKAYVWYAVSYTESTAPNSTVTITNPVAQSAAYSSVKIATDQGKCWTGDGEVGSAAYRADVTPVVSGNGSYIIDIAGIQLADSAIDGITLMVIYKDLNASYNGHLIIYDGLRAGAGNLFKDSIMNMNVCANSIFANGFNIIADMQENVNGNTHSSTINGTSHNFPNDFWNFDLWGDTIIQGQTTSIFGTDGLGSDCFGWIAMGLYFQENCVLCCTSLTALAQSTPSTCTGSTGTAQAMVGCGTTPYTYSWSDGQTTALATGLSAGTYTVIVTDSILASDTVIVFIGMTNFSASAGVTSVSCFGGSNGAASASATGGTPPYTYLWSPGGQTTSAISGLSAGSYTVSVQDAGGCSATQTVMVTGSPQLNTTSYATPSSCWNCPDGSVSISATGGTPPYSVVWTPSGQTTWGMTGLMPGTYIGCVIDSKYCQKCDTLYVVYVGVNELLNQSLQISPNPAGEYLLLDFGKRSFGAAEIRITTIIGGHIMETRFEASGRKDLDVSKLPQGVYFLTIRTAAGHVTRKLMITR